MLPVAGPTLLSFAGIAALVLVTPGPSLLLIASASLDRGLRGGLVAVAGTATGLAIVVLAVVLGLGAVARHLGGWAEGLRWLGVAWLVASGLRELRQARAPRAAPPGGGFWQALAVSALNPSTTPFLLALLPQFLDLNRPAGPQLATLAAVFLGLAAMVDMGCALAAARIRAAWSGARATATRHRASAALLFAAAALLAVARTS